MIPHTIKALSGIKSHKGVLHVPVELELDRISLEICIDLVFVSCLVNRLCREFYR